MLTYIETKHIPTSAIVTSREDRARKDYGDMDEFSRDVMHRGQINAITVSAYDDGTYHLITGGRRVLACQMLSREVRATVVSVQGEIDLLELELFENRSRKAMLWWEEASLDARIHAYYIEQNPDWTQKKSAKHLGISESELSKRIALARYIDNEAIAPVLKTYPDATSAMRRIREVIQDNVVEKKAQEILTRDANAEPEQEPTAEQPKQRTVSTGNAPVAVLPGKYWKQVYKAFRVGDALRGMKRMKDGDFTGAEVDPPYGIDLHEQRGQVKNTHSLDKYQEIEKGKYPEFLEATATQVYRLLADDSFCIWWFGVEWYKEVRETLQGVGFGVSPVPCLWIKDRGQTNNPATTFASVYETFFLARKGSPKLQKRGRDNVFPAKGVPAQQKVHPTEKPALLMKEILEIVFPENTRLLVPFLGSGRTLIEAHRMNMFGTGWDLEERNKNYFINAVKKVEECGDATD